MTTVLAVDPGLMSGWAYHHEDGHRAGQLEFDEMMGVAEFLEPDVFVCERYTVTAETLRKSRQTTALEIIGCLRWLAHKRGVPFVLQSPADAKRFATNKKLEAAGWLLPSSQDHANDALRHLLLYRVKNKMMEMPR
jgi:hypothetical protein